MVTATGGKSVVSLPTGGSRHKGSISGAMMAALALLFSVTTMYLISRILTMNRKMLKIEQELTSKLANDPIPPPPTVTEERINSIIRDQLRQAIEIETNLQTSSEQKELAAQYDSLAYASKEMLARVSEQSDVLGNCIVRDMTAFQLSQSQLHHLNLFDGFVETGCPLSYSPILLNAEPDVLSKGPVPAPATAPTNGDSGTNAPPQFTATQAQPADVSQLADVSSAMQAHTEAQTVAPVAEVWSNEPAVLEIPAQVQPVVIQPTAHFEIAVAQPQVADIWSNIEADKVLVAEVQSQENKEAQEAVHFCGGENPIEGKCVDVEAEAEEEEGVSAVPLVLMVPLLMEMAEGTPSAVRSTPDMVTICDIDNMLNMFETIQSVDEMLTDFDDFEARTTQRNRANRSSPESGSSDGRASRGLVEQNDPVVESPVVEKKGRGRRKASSSSSSSSLLSPNVIKPKRERMPRAGRYVGN